MIASAAGLALFLSIAVAQGLVESSYDPLRQGLSEFVHTDATPLALVAFVAWATSLVTLARLIADVSARRDRPRSASIEIMGLWAAAVGLVLVACFVTDRGADAPGVITETTTSGRLHDLGSSLVTVSILLAIVADAVRERDARLACGVIGVAVLSAAILFALGDPLPGLRQRFLVASACVWQLAILRRFRVRPATSDRSSEGSRCSTS